ncbi:T5orf172 domain-containing protein [Modicisalibacter xianhensis]|uniref:T5orf172 domain-containing protein n=1 Tax=Modicisalibacter xianhensis TaxID=442341 RepID=A0A4R8FCH2_9GAMM|nr:GIY-YIG nuclease family protein [Halomonas xianhensis]TDX22942.1 T5orf172 domain-containing protein [Halomonas xianhensis]
MDNDQVYLPGQVEPSPSADKEIIYVLSNPAMPGLVKIGRTSQADVTLRMNQLYTTGVPVPFECVYAVEVECLSNVETALHTAFAPSRINPSREFFQIESEQAVAIMRILGGTDVTPQLNAELSANISQAEKESGKKIRRPRMDFVEMGLATGDVLTYKDGEATVTVVDNRTVRLNDADMSLTAATRELMGISHSVQPAPYWFCNGKSIKQLYEETYPFDAEG